MSETFSHATFKGASGFVCSSPYNYHWEGEIFTRSCGRCDRCCARIKRDIEGRAAAQSAISAEMVFFTLTYRDDVPGHAEFVTRDRQLFLKRLRASLHEKARLSVGAPKRFPKGATAHVKAYWKERVSEALPKITYVGCGERGENGSRRCHWHICCFASRKTGLVSSKIAPSGKYIVEKHPLWELGFTTLSVLDLTQVQSRMKAVRYCVKYVMKARAVRVKERRAGVPPEAMFFRSTGKPLGHDYLVNHAREVARAALPLTGKYTVPGVTSTAKGGGPIKSSVFVVQGKMRDYYIAAYRDEWFRLRPGKPIAPTPWQLMFDDDWSDDFSEKADPASGTKKPFRLFAPNAGASSSVDVVRRPAPAVPVEPGMVLVRDGKGAPLGFVVIDEDGLAAFEPVEGDIFSLGSRGVRDLPGVTAVTVRGVDQWIAKRRGPDWLSPGDRRKAEREYFAACRSAIERFSLDGPNVNADRPYLPEERGLTALKRQFRLNGDGHVPGTVVTDGSSGEAEIRGVSRPLKPLDRRKP